ncbi:hypothetical protein AMTR_s00075p00087750 [Amborella trichopoda]|uniref:Uncharacterized protein n=1 Tax=Amborella trichopoda TaxID=13333 RepID=W1PC21_AMBTC|nr:hypothetical protein AMTR_s00075p00087750 [Amborella trichopoda]
MKNGVIEERAVAAVWYRFWGLARRGGDSDRHLVLMVRGGWKSGLGTRGREGSGCGCQYLVEKGGWKREEKNGSWVACCSCSGLKKKVQQ